jgi:hypothetical protein
MQIQNCTYTDWMLISDPNGGASGDSLGRREAGCTEIQVYALPLEK